MVGTRVEIKKMVQQHEANGDTAEAVKFGNPQASCCLSDTFQQTVTFLGV